MPTSSSPVHPGQTFAYRVTVTNNGLSSAANVRMSDPLPVGLTFVSSANGCTAAGQTVSCGPHAALAAGASVSWTFTVRLSPSYTGDGSDLGNVATTSSDATDPNPGNNTNPPAQPPGPIVPSADMSLAKTAASGPPVAGQNTTFTLTATNHGPSDAAGVTITDTLPSELTYVSSSPTGCTLSGQTVTCAAGQVPSGATVTYTVTARVGASVTPGGGS